MSHRSKIGSLFDVDTKSTAPLVNNVLQFDGTDWIPASLNALPTTGGTLTGDLTIEDTTAGSAAGPELTLTRDITGADGNYLGQLKFLGNNDVDQSNVYAKITAKISDATDTTEDGLIEFALRKDGSNVIVGRLTSTDLKLINGTGLEVDGDISAGGTVDGRDVATDGTKLDTIATNADVTDSTSVTAAGALMDSELTSIADVKALNQSLVSGAAPVLDATNFTNLPSGSVSIGDAVGGSTINTVLFSDGSGNLANNSKFLFNGTSLNYTGPSSVSTSCTSFGLYAGNGNSSNEVVSIGNGAGQSSSGVRKTSIGYSAGKSSSGTEGTYLGNSAGQSSGGNRNQYIGYRCGMNRSSGGANNGMGDYSFFAGSGTQNSALGTSSQNSSVGSFNSSSGSSSLAFNSGSNNNAIGYRAGNSNTGSYVLALGDLAGWGNTQSNVTIIGQSHLPQFAGAVAAAAALPAASANGVYLYWDTTDDTIKARP